MISAEYKALTERSVMPDAEYFKDPYAFWHSIPFGERGLPESVTKKLPFTLHLENIPKNIQQQILKEHPYSWGMDYWSVEMQKDKLKAILVTGYPVKSTHIQKVPGLVYDVKHPEITYPWQAGLGKVQDYYLYNSKDGRLQSLQQIAHALTRKEVVFYYYGAEFQEQSAQMAYLMTETGRLYYAIFHGHPTTLFDIIALIHELAHIKQYEGKPDRQNELDQLANYQNEYEAYLDLIREIENSGLSEEFINSNCEEASSNFLRSAAFARMLGAKMIYEFECWQIAMPILETLGILDIFNESPQELLDIIFFTIKTRIPPREMLG